MNHSPAPLALSPDSGCPGGVLLAPDAPGPSPFPTSGGADDGGFASEHTNGFVRRTPALRGVEDLRCLSTAATAAGGGGGGGGSTILKT